MNKELQTLSWAIEHLDFSDICDSAKNIIKFSLENKEKKLVSCEYKLEEVQEDNFLLQLRIKELVERATPMRIDIDLCPICGSQYGYEANFCSDCGQALDWE